MKSMLKYPLKKTCNFGSHVKLAKLEVLLLLFGKFKVESHTSKKRARFLLLAFLSHHPEMIFHHSQMFQM